MFAEGKIKTYNDERGFGFIDVDGEKKNLFFHIRDMPNKHIQPKVGERLKFRMVEDQGKLKADNIERLDVVIEKAEYKKNVKRSYDRTDQRESTHHHFSGHGLTLMGVVVIGVLGYMIYGKYERAQLA